MVNPDELQYVSFYRILQLQCAGCPNFTYVTVNDTPNPACNAMDKLNLRILDELPYAKVDSRCTLPDMVFQ